MPIDFRASVQSQSIYCIFSWLHFKAMSAKEKVRSVHAKAVKRQFHEVPWI